MYEYEYEYFKMQKMQGQVFELHSKALWNWEPPLKQELGLSAS